MKERPILFSAPMVRAILGGTKTQTRRVVKPQPREGWNFDDAYGRIKSAHPTNGEFGAFIRRGVGSDFPEIDIVPCPYGQPGDRLWVRETWATNGCYDYLPPRKLDRHCFAPEIGDGGYRATASEGEEHGKWRPSIFLPRWASRITLAVVAVRVERLQDITEADALAEGIHAFKGEQITYYHYLPTAAREEHFRTAVDAYRALWESINDKNPPRGEIRQGTNPFSWDANPYVWVIEFKKL